MIRGACTLTANMCLLLKVLLTEHRLMERNHAALQHDLASCQGELAARCDDLEVLKDAHTAAEAQVTQQSQDIQVSPHPPVSIRAQYTYCGPYNQMCCTIPEKQLHLLYLT